jgi:hypothetical protein
MALAARQLVRASGYSTLKLMVEAGIPPVGSSSSAAGWCARY